MTSRVVHVNDQVPEAVYIGRANGRKRLAASPFGNPFKVSEMPRAEVMTRYAAYIDDRLRREPELSEQLIALRGKPLACWCRHDGEPVSPENACHGDILVELLDRYADAELRR